MGVDKNRLNLIRRKLEKTTGSVYHSLDCDLCASHRIEKIKHKKPLAHICFSKKDIEWLIDNLDKE